MTRRSIKRKGFELTAARPSLRPVLSRRIADRLPLYVRYGVTTATGERQMLGRRKAGKRSPAEEPMVCISLLEGAGFEPSVPGR
jgi:hypothetical protein